MGTGTCGFACWMAQEDVCRCMCSGANHGIMRSGGEQPGRFCQRKGKQFRLEGLVGGWIEATDEASRLSKEYNAAHSQSWWVESAFQQSASGHTLKWPEVQAYLSNQHKLPDPQCLWCQHDPTSCRRHRPEAFLVWVRMN